MNARYAIYFAPARHSPWWNFGAYWLGRDEFDNLPLQQLVPLELRGVQLDSLTLVPRRYGFHGTLKAPFHLAKNHGEADLFARLQSLAKTLGPLALGKIHTKCLGNFVALVPQAEVPGLQALAAACVIGLDNLRAPLDDKDLHRRGIASLDAREIELLKRYGYPYVMERFRLHFTLTGPIPESDIKPVIQAVEGKVSVLNAQAPLVLDRLCLFKEAEAGEPFIRIADCELLA